ncbi:MAG: flagellar biosynthetic protein FliR [Thermomonas sp.]|uniref:flagellar biosynthetic protein FliR n=1 Tax=Thermomonas sp. TaxID=1971895 RepID=UPI001ED4571F|nr:flagellar biosynthetic protein FliR [Thermomonas sp.]MBV2210356.1 flagellar biosynthetic protein FliR [Thermomonas sp.]
MDTITLTTATGINLFALFSTVLWYSLRVGAMLQVLPFVGGRGIPLRARLLLILVLSAMMASFLPAPPAATVSALTTLSVLRELAIGAAIGLMIRLAFEAGNLAGQFISQDMALSFATMTDPANQSSMSVVSLWFFITFGLMFFTLDAHLALISLVADSYRAVPIGVALPDTQAFLARVPEFVPVILRASVLISLPVTVALLSVHIIVGVLARAAPQLNPIQIGMPVALLMGLFLLAALAQELLGPIRALFMEAFQAARAVTG